jgi:hypothetical protein
MQAGSNTAVTCTTDHRSTVVSLGSGSCCGHELASRRAVPSGVAPPPFPSIWCTTANSCAFPSPSCSTVALLPAVALAAMMLGRGPAGCCGFPRQPRLLVLLLAAAGQGSASAAAAPAC